MASVVWLGSELAQHEATTNGSLLLLPFSVLQLLTAALTKESRREASFQCKQKLVTIFVAEKGRVLSPQKRRGFGEEGIKLKRGQRFLARVMKRQKLVEKSSSVYVEFPRDDSHS